MGSTELAGNPAPIHVDDNKVISTQCAVKLRRDMEVASLLQMSVVKLTVRTFSSLDEMKARTFSYSFCSAVSDMYLHPGTLKHISLKSIKRRNPTFATTAKGWSCRKINSTIRSLTLMARCDSFGNFSLCLKESSNVCCLCRSLLAARTALCSSEWRVFKCLNRLQVLKGAT